ncbi:MAG: hypothetical protein V4560_16905 [Bacteroidota bacterium]
MKNLKFKVAALGLIILVAACGRPGRHVIISEGDNNGSLRIEYSGRAFFNEDSTAIARITPNGYVKYKRDGQSLIAERDGRDDITYYINGGPAQTKLSGNDKVFLAQAVKVMVKRGHNSD